MTATTDTGGGVATSVGNTSVTEAVLPASDASTVRAASATSTNAVVPVRTISGNDTGWRGVVNEALTASTAGPLRRQ